MPEAAASHFLSHQCCSPASVCSGRVCLSLSRVRGGGLARNDSDTHGQRDDLIRAATSKSRPFPAHKKRNRET